MNLLELGAIKWRQMELPRWCFVALVVGLLGAAYIVPVNAAQNINIVYPTFPKSQIFTQTTPEFLQIQKELNLPYPTMTTLAIYIPYAQLPFNKKKLDQFMIIMQPSALVGNTVPLEKWQEVKNKQVNEVKELMNKQKTALPTTSSGRSFKYLGVFTPRPESFATLASTQVGNYILAVETTTNYINGQIIIFLVSREIKKPEDLTWVQNVSKKATNDLITGNVSTSAPSR